MGRFVGAVLSALQCVAIVSMPALGAEPLRGLLSRLNAENPHVAAWVGHEREEEYWRAISFGLTDEAQITGIELAYRRSVGPLGSVDEQAAQLDEIASLKPTIVFLSPVRTAGLESALEKLRDAGSKVVVVGAPLRRGPVAVAVLQDQVKIGARMASYICASNPEARIATIPGPAGQAWNRQRFNGFRSEVERTCPEARLFGNLYRLGISIPHGQVQAADLAIKYPQVNFIYAASGLLAVGAANIRQRLRQRVAIVTAGFTRESAAALTDREIAMTVSEPGVLIGRLAVQYAIRAAEGKSLPGAVSGPHPYLTVFVPNVSITGDLINEYNIASYDLAPEGWTPDAK